MILRDLADRARSEGMRAVRGVVDGVRDLLSNGSFSNGSTSELYVVRGAAQPGPDGAVWWSREPGVDGATPAPTEPATAELGSSLDKIAETVDRLAAQLDANHVEHARQLDAIEFLLREVVLGGASNRSVVLGGVVDPPALEADREITLVPDGALLEVDTPVEVRSRFHDRWICGFAVAEVIDGRPGTGRYRLTRRSDGIPLPLLFDACDVRAASVLERQPAAD